jgi:hypothetical protein
VNESTLLACFPQEDGATGAWDLPGTAFQGKKRTSKLATVDDYLVEKNSGISLNILLPLLPFSCSSFLDYTWFPKRTS